MIVITLQKGIDCTAIAL